MATNFLSSFIDALQDPNVIKEAHNAQFERVCFSKFIFGNLKKFLDPGQWRCTMAHSSYLGLPLSLGDVGKALGLAEDKKKLNTGKALIRYFSVPSKTKGRERNMPYHAMDRWLLYVEYNKQDVVTEVEIEKILSRYPMPEAEQRVYAMDQRINDRGARLDMELVNDIIEFNNEYQDKLLSRAQEITGLSNPNSPKQLLEWLKKEILALTRVKRIWSQILSSLRTTKTLEKCFYLDKRWLRHLLRSTTLWPTLYVMMIALEECSCTTGPTGPAPGPGRLVQVQNLPRNEISELADVRDIVKAKDFESLEMIYEQCAGYS